MKKTVLILFISITLVGGVFLTNPFFTTFMNQSLNSFRITNNDDNIEQVDIDDKVEPTQDSDLVPIEQPPLPKPAPTTVLVVTKPEDKTIRELEVLKLVNIERQNDGKEPLTYLSNLEKGANIRALEIKELWSHTRPDGTLFYTAYEYMNYRTIGENLAAGYTTPEEVVAGWMSSEGHRTNMLNEDYEQMAIAVSEDADGRLYWVQILYRGR